MPIARQQPNVLFILADQLRHDVFSHRGNAIITTPSIDRLAREGVLFTQAICSSPLCGPSRAALLSGCHPNGGRYRFANADPEEPGLWTSEIITVDEALKQAGYHVEYHGKWHVGRDHLGCYESILHVFGHRISDYSEYLLARGYRRATPGPGHKVDRYTGWSYRYWDVDPMMEEAARKGHSMPHHNEAGIIEVAREDTLTAWTVGKTIRFLESSPAQPFAVTCSILHPHAPLITCEYYADQFDPAKMPMPPNLEAASGNEALTDGWGRPPVPEAVAADATGLGQFTALYYALVKELDDWVGRLLEALDRTGLAPNTLVIFTSDHGELMGSHRTFSKSLFYEECLRVPLVMRWLEGIPPGREVSAPATGADIAPTILDYAEVPLLEQFTGRSLRKAVEGREASHGFAFSQLGHACALRSDKWKQIYRDRQAVALYDLENDPYEGRNLLNDSRVQGSAEPPPFPSIESWLGAGSTG